MKTKIYICIIVFFLIAFFVSMSPMFSIEEYKIDGNNLVATNEILESANLVNLGSNIFTYSARKYENELKKNTYFEDVKIKKQYPSTISIEINERAINFYTLYSNNTYLYMNNEGIVIDVKQNFTLSRPIVKGLDFNTFTLGKQLDYKDKYAFDSAVLIIKTIKRYGDFDEQIIIDISDPYNIHILLNNINIVFGDTLDADIKVRRAIAAIPEIDPNLKGYLYVDDVSSSAYFKIIT